MTDFDLCSLIAAMDISQVEFARRIGKGERTIRGYCSGERPIPLLVQREAARMWEEHQAAVGPS